MCIRDSDYTAAFTLLGYIILGIGVAIFIFRTITAQKKTDIKDLTVVPVVHK
jgi:NNP family nitrate/nitrite transporter-like MFS transporter